MRERINLRSALGLDDPRFEAQRVEIRQQIEIAQKLYDLRAEHGLSQEEAAKLGGTTTMVVNQIEESDYDLKQAIRILDRIAKTTTSEPAALTSASSVARPA